MSDAFEEWGEFDFTQLTDEQYCSKIAFIREKFPQYRDDPRMREVPPPRPKGEAQEFGDFFTVTFISNEGKIVGLYQKRDQYLFASQVVRDGGPSQPFEMLQKIEFTLPYSNYRRVELDVTYDSLQGSTILSYTRADLSNAVTVLARGFEGNENWGPALATLIGTTSEAIKSYGMEWHVCRGLNIASNVQHCPSERLLRVKNNWSSISKSVRNKKYNFVLRYKNEYGEDVDEHVSRFSAGKILAVINFKDGSKREKFNRKLEMKEHGKRGRDGNEENEGGGSEKKKKGRGGKKDKREKRNFKSPSPFQVKMTVRNIYYSSDSCFSDSEVEDPDLDASDAANKEEDLIVVPEITGEDKSPAVPKEATVLVQVPTSSTAYLMSGLNICDSSILVKHGTKHQVEAGDKDDDKDSKRAKTSEE